MHFDDKCIFKMVVKFVNQFTNIMYWESNVGKRFDLVHQVLGSNPAVLLHVLNAFFTFQE